MGLEIHAFDHFRIETICGEIIPCVYAVFAPSITFARVQWEFPRSPF